MWSATPSPIRRRTPRSSSTPRSRRKASSLRVTDDGPGIPADVLPHVFEKFVRARRDRVTPEGGEGTGLGLAIAKGIMEAHGGSIAAESPVAGRPRHPHHAAVSRAETPA